MKKNLLFIFFLFFGIVNGQEPEISNAGFETRETVTIYESPKDWMTNVDMSWLFKRTAKYTVSFTVKKENEEPVEGAEITITQNDAEAEVITIGADGKAEADLPEGDYNYAVTADQYGDDSGSFTVVDEDKDISLTLLHVELFNKPSLSDKINVYPNPGDGLFHVEYSAGEVKTITLEVVSITGNLFYVREFRGIGTLKETIDLQHINKGVYLLRLRENGKISTIKMIFR